MARHPRKAPKSQTRHSDSVRLNPEFLEPRNVMSPCVPGLLGDFDGSTGKLGAPPATPDAEVVLFGGDWNDDFAGFPGETGANLFGNEGNDSVLASNAATQITMFGGDGDDSLTVTGGTDVTVFGGDGDDSLGSGGSGDVTLGGAGGDTLGVPPPPGGNPPPPPPGDNITLFGGEGNDTLLPPGAGTNVTVFGGDGDDTLVVGGGTQVTVFGGDGDDSLTVTGGTDVTVFGGDSDDTIAVTGGTSVTVFGGDGNDSLAIAAGTQVTVFGGDGDDTIAVVGSGSDITLFGWGADDGFFVAPTHGPADSEPARGSTTVYVDFDSATDPGEWVYTPTERAAVLGRLRETFADFRFEFVSTQPTSGPFIHVAFNAGPAGGSSSQLDLGDRDPGGDANVNVNGLLGRPGGVPLDSGTVTAVSATIAAHEIGHLLGLRHADAFGPIGTGVYAGPNRSDLGYLPRYEPGAATETPLHIMGSPRSIGTSLAAAAGSTYFGEREAIKLSFAQSGLTVEEQNLPQLASGARFLGALPDLAVPNTLRPGAAHYGDTFDVGAIAVDGAITLRADGHSENDTYAFFGRAGELVNMEISSASRVPLPGNPIDSVLRVFDSTGRQIVWNDDGFESTDSEIIDLRLPADGLYYVVVDTYTPDGITDSDIGTYELFVSRFASTPGPVAGSPTTGPVLPTVLPTDGLPPSPIAEPILPVNPAPGAPTADPVSASAPATGTGVFLPPTSETPTDLEPTTAPPRVAAVGDPVAASPPVSVSTTDGAVATTAPPDGGTSARPDDDLSLSLDPRSGQG